jgi:hypothetical protein
VGSVTFVQRFGDALNMHVHFHAVCPDGVFTVGGDGVAVFHKVAPTHEEVLEVCLKTRQKALRWLEKEGADMDEPVDGLARLQTLALQEGVRNFV